MLMSLREAYVTQYWKLRPKGRTVLSALIQCISQDRSWFSNIEDTKSTSDVHLYVQELDIVCGNVVYGWVEGVESV